MKIIYIILVILILMYLIFKPRKIDYLSVYAASSIVYYFPLILGILNDTAFVNGAYRYSRTDISEYTYIFGIFNISIIFFWLFLKDNTVNFNYNNLIPYNCEDQSSIDINDQVISLASIVLCVVMSLSVLRNLQYLFSGNGFNKVLFIQNVTLLETIARYLGLFVSIYAFTRNKISKTQSIIGILYILYSNLMGRRSDTVQIFIAAAVYRFIFSSREPRRLFYYIRKHKVLFTAGIIIVCLIFPIKRSLPLFISGKIKEGIAYTIECFFDPKTYLISESNSITLYINKIFNDNNYLVPFWPYAMDFLSIIPFGNALTGSWIKTNSFDVYFQRRYFPTITSDVAGLAGSFWAESFINWDWLGTVVMMNLICFLICIVEKKAVLSKNSIWYPVYLIIVVHLSFYIHRLFLSHFINVLKYLLFIVILVYILKLLNQNVKITIGNRRL